MTGDFWPLGVDEEVLDDPREIYFRQCSEHAMDRGRPSVRMFRESSSDTGKLSGARPGKTTAEATFQHARARSPGRAAPVGTYGLTVEQIHGAGEETGLRVRAVDDSQVWDGDTPPGHTYLDQRHLGDRPSNPDKRALRAALYLRAMENERFWPPPGGSPVGGPVIR